MTGRPRPLSPHLGIYRPMHTMVLSILHRASGLALSVGALGVVGWLVALAAGPASYQAVMNVLDTPVGVLVRVGLLLAFWYHFCAGLRHLMFDLAIGLERRDARRAGLLVVLGTVLLSGLSILLWWGCAS